MAARGTPGFSPVIAAANIQDEHLQKNATPYDFLVGRATSGFAKVTDHGIAAGCNVALAYTACALERYRLAHGSYPVELAALVPEYSPVMPRDLIDGQALRYRCLSSGSYELYSIGLDGRDDDGRPATGVGAAAGDWVWPQLAR